MKALSFRRLTMIAAANKKIKINSIVSCALCVRDEFV